MSFRHDFHELVNTFEVSEHEGRDDDVLVMNYISPSCNLLPPSSHSRLSICEFLFFCLFKKQTALSGDNINTDGKLKFNGKYKHTEERFEMLLPPHCHATTVEI